MKDAFLFRTRIVQITIITIALVTFIRLFFIQIIYGTEFSELADRQYVQPSSHAFDRGSIFFERKDGRLFSAATLQSGFLLAIVPEEIKNPHETFEALSAILPSIDKSSFLLRAEKTDDPYEEVAHRISNNDAERIQALNLPGIFLYREKWRLYPSGPRAAHSIGFVGYEGDTLGGRYGLERYYDYILKREDKDLYVNFFAEVFANIEQSLFYENSEREGDIVLTIEPDVLQALDQIFGRVVLTWHASSGGALIVNPQTGAISAMTLYPSFDPNQFQKVDDILVFSNPIVENVFEMGSIIKPLTVAIGLDTGAIKPDDTYVDQGYVIVDGKRIENYDGKARGAVSMQEVLNQSLNTGAVYVMRKIGRDRFREYMRAFGLGEETGIDLPNEITGLTGNLDSPRDVEYATASFGQGIATTPIGTVRALTALANHGKLSTPHIVSRITYPLGSSKKIAYNENKPVLKSETAEIITRMLVRVVDEALLEGTVKLPRYSIAAKTGTAQIARPEVGGYYDDRFLHAFFGYFPAYDPQFLIFLYLVNPQDVRYASQTLTAPFMDTVKFLINYYEIAPDR